MTLAALIDAAIPFAGGLLVIWFGYVRHPGREKQGEKPPLIRRLRWLGPVLLIFGVWRVGSVLTSEPRGTDARALAAALRSRYHPPAMLDAQTRLDDLVAVGQHVVFQATITQAPASEPERQEMLVAMGRTLKARYCGEPVSRKYISGGIGFQFEYTIEGRSYPAIVVTRNDCGL